MQSDCKSKCMRRYRQVHVHLSLYQAYSIQSPQNVYGALPNKDEKHKTEIKLLLEPIRWAENHGDIIFFAFTHSTASSAADVSTLIKYCRPNHVGAIMHNQTARVSATLRIKSRVYKRKKVIKVIWQKSRIAAAHGLISRLRIFARLRQYAHMVRVATDSPKLDSPDYGYAPPSNTCFLGPIPWAYIGLSQSIYPVASQLVQPFLRRSRQRVPIL